MTYKIEIYPQAASNFNTKAIEILGLVKSVTNTSNKVETASASFKPEIYIPFTIDKSTVVGNTLFKHENYDGSSVIYFHINDELFCIVDVHRFLNRLLESIQKIRSISTLISLKTTETILCDWLKVKYCNPDFLEFTQYFILESEKRVQEHELWLPIQYLHIQKSFDLGKLLFQPITRDMLDLLEERSVVKNPQQESMIRQLFENKIRPFQGYAAATLSVTAEEKRASEILLEETGLSLKMLRIFSPAVLDPKQICHYEIWGSAHVDCASLMTLQGGDLRNICITTTGFRPQSDTLDSERIDVIFAEGLEILSQLLKKNDKSQFEQDVLDALTLYSQCTTLKSLSDKLVYILVALESLFLRDSSEPIQQNLGERMAFLIGNSVDEKKIIARSVRQVYTLRSKFVHHGTLIGASVDDDDAMREFMLYAWRAFIETVKLTKTFYQRKDLLDQLDDRKFS